MYSNYLEMQISRVPQGPVNHTKSATILPVQAEPRGTQAISPEAAHTRRILPLVGPRDRSMEYMEVLRSLVFPETDLENSGYVLQQLSESMIERKKRCQQCTKSKFTRSRV